MNLTHRILIAGLLLTGMSANVLADTGDINPDARVPSYYGTFGDSCTGEEILVVRDYLPWGGDVVPYLVNAGAVCTVITTADIPATNLADYCLIFLEAGTSQPGDPIEASINAAMPQIADYVSLGGDLLFFTGTWGAVYTFPGGGSNVYDYQVWNDFCNPGHPIADSMPNPFEGNYASHEHFIGYPGNATCITTDTIGGWTGLEYNYGQGHVVLMGHPVECYLEIGGYCYPQAPHFEILLINATFYATNCDDGWAEAEEQAQSFGLHGNYPNPFNPSTTISFSIEQTGPVSLRVFDITGREVAALVNGLVELGEHSVNFDAGDLSSGTYFYSLEADGRVDSRKMLLLK